MAYLPRWCRSIAPRRLRRYSHHKIILRGAGATHWVAPTVFIRNKNEIAYLFIGIIRNLARSTFPADFLDHFHVDLPGRAFSFVHQKTLEPANRSSADSRRRS